MLDLQLRDKNRVITMAVPGKTPLKGRRGSSPYYHNSLDFLLAALGTCMGGTISDYCRFNDLNSQIFENINLATDGDKFIVTIKRPEDFAKEHMERLGREITKCPVSHYLTHDVEVRWEFNEKPVEELIVEPKGCCGE